MKRYHIANKIPSSNVLPMALDVGTSPAPALSGTAVALTVTESRLDFSPEINAGFEKNPSNDEEDSNRRVELKLEFELTMVRRLEEEAWKGPKLLRVGKLRLGLGFWRDCRRGVEGEIENEIPLLCIFGFGERETEDRERETEKW